MLRSEQTIVSCALDRETGWLTASAAVFDRLLPGVIEPSATWAGDLTPRVFIDRYYIYR
jgi:hypothetical protein